MQTIIEETIITEDENFSFKEIQTGNWFFNGVYHYIKINLHQAFCVSQKTIVDFTGDEDKLFKVIKHIKILYTS